MGYRIVVVSIITAIMLSACAAFDNSNEPYEGFAPEDIPAPSVNIPGSKYAGFYSGEMALELNTCKSITDKVGATVPLAVDVIDKDNVVDLTFEDESVAAATLENDKATFLKEDGDVKHVYYLTFADGSITGNCEVIEADENGEFAKACASYAVELKKGEKKAEEGGEKK